MGTNKAIVKPLTRENTLLWSHRNHDIIHMCMKNLSHYKTYSKKVFTASFVMMLFLPFTSIAQSDPAQNTKVYRFYSDNYRAHFYTNSQEERDLLIDTNPNWCYEGIAYYTPTQKTDTKPLFRFYSPVYKSHFFTISSQEKDFLIQNDSNWNYEGIAYNVSTSSEGNLPLHRFYSPVFNAHFFTTSEQEKAQLINNDANWNYEGIAFYATSGPLELPETVCGRPIPVGEVGPDISVGLDEYERDDIREDPIVLSATKAFNAIDSNGRILGSVKPKDEINIYYDGDSMLKLVIGESETLVDREIFFRAQAAEDDYNIIFTVSRPDSIYDEFRHSMKIRYTKSVRRIWTINTLPLELYVWGIGEITATGPEEYNKLMTTAFRTYGYWKLLNSTTFAAQGFTVVATPANQIYGGYKWEKDHPRIREAATQTRGKVVTYDNKVILLPFSSWTDGNTRHYLDGHWGSNCKTDPKKEISSAFPYLIGVDDSQGKHPSSDTCALAAGGNHMVGISANGALNRAKQDDKWDDILKHYITDIDLQAQY